MPIRRSINGKVQPKIEVSIDGPKHPRAFEGLLPRVGTNIRDTQCRKCHGYGKWNYILNYLNKEGVNRTQDCNLCSGYGFVPADMANECEHSWRTEKLLNRAGTLSLLRCTKCKTTQERDSS